MKTNVKAVRRELNTLAEDARLLVNATADIPEQSVVEARNRLATALKEQQGILARTRDRASQTVQAANRGIKHHPYRALGVAFGLGALFGLLLSRKA